MSNDQVLAQHPSEGQIEVDVMMKPLLEVLWARGIETKYSDTGGNLEPYPFVADEARKKALNAIPMGRFALEEKWKEVGFDQTGDLGVKGNINNMSGYLWFASKVPSVVPQKFVDETDTIRWDAAKDYANLREIYAAFGVDFPDTAGLSDPRSLRESVP